MCKIVWLPLLTTFVSFLLGVYFYPRLPDKIASHWNIHGQVDGYLPKAFGLFLLPLISLLLYLLFLLIPKLDPLKENLKKFRRYYDYFIAVVILFLFYLYLLTIAWNLGLRFNFGQVLAPAFAILWCFVGILIQKAKQNWSIGIRTPWTLSNENVWEKTHQIGGRLFRLAGGLALLGVLFPQYAFFLVVVPPVLIVIYTFIYSYWRYQKP